MNIAGTSLVLAAALSFSAAARADSEVLLGRFLYEDKNLSLLRDQSCASCHTADTVGGGLARILKHVVADDDAARSNVQDALQSALLGTPAHDTSHAAHGQLVEASAAATAIAGPSATYRAFLGLTEMAMPSELAVIQRLQEQVRYRVLFEEVYGVIIDDISVRSPKPVISQTFKLVARAIAAFARARSVPASPLDLTLTSSQRPPSSPPLPE